MPAGAGADGSSRRSLSCAREGGGSASWARDGDGSLPLSPRSGVPSPPRRRGRCRPAASSGPSGPSPSAASGPSASSSLASSAPGSSNGPRRCRCGSASRAATRTSSPITSSRCCHAAWAIAVRQVTRSPRMPSTPRVAQAVVIRSSSASLISALPSRARAAAIWLVASRSRLSNAWALADGDRSCSSRARTTAALRSGSELATTGTHSPNRSSSCGRSSPSSGFMVPTSRKLDACRSETPSRSTLVLPVAAASSSTSTMWSGSKLISST